MRNGLPSLYALQIFEAAARRLNFTRAAEELGLTQGAISHQIKALEADLGVLLFERVGRSVRLTRHGADLLPVLGESFAQIREMMNTIRREAAEGSGEVSIATTTYFASRWLSGRLAKFMGSHPEVAVRVAHAAADGSKTPPADLEVRWGDGGWPNCNATLLFEAALTPVCSPSLIQNRRRPISVREIEGCAFLHDDETQLAWRRWLDHAGVGDPGVIRGPVIVDPNVRMQAAVDGQGFALADDLVSGELETGRLVAPMDVRLTGYGYYMVCRSPEHSTPQTSLFADWLLAESRAPV